uniref:Histocompatibility (minor) 13 n=1 Tax=Acanthochromis polyacanthus TaxID=80966 RepID=A0A3Q1F8A0_9TELE
MIISYMAIFCRSADFHRFNFKFEHFCDSSKSVEKILGVVRHFIVANVNETQANSCEICKNMRDSPAVWPWRDISSNQTLGLLWGYWTDSLCSGRGRSSQQHLLLCIMNILYVLYNSETVCFVCFSPLMSRIFPASCPNKQYQLLFTQGSGESKEEIVNYEFDTKNLVCLVISSVVGVWYLLKKHWIANNLFGLAFALNGVELLHLNNVSTGCILLGGLFVYDVFWVFGTNVMVTVAKSFEAPIKLVFPQDLLEKGLEASNFAMLGLGDIVIPGIFIALLLRFDVSLKKNSRTYFYSSFLAYIFGLGLTIFVMHTFKHAQPALLYLVPACVGFPVIVALFKGELTEMFSLTETVDERVEAAD